MTNHRRLARRNLLKTMLGASALPLAVPTVVPVLHHAASAQGTPDATASSTASAVHRGEMLAVTPVATMSAEQVTKYIRNIGLDASQARVGVDAWQVVYATVDPEGNPTTASGLVALPRNHSGDLRLVSWLHGTTVYRGDVASVSAESADRMIAFAFASAGYAVSAPDYLGLGLGPGYHPYDHVPSTVTASVDAIRATRSLAGQEGATLDDRLLISGFSQGGPATMALGEAIQSGADPTMQLGALAPISGPYDFSGTLHAGLAGEISSAPQYLAYLVVAWNRLHGIYDAPGEAFLEPYDAVVETLIDNNHTADEVFEGIPVSQPSELFTPQFMDLLEQPSGSLRDALAVADSTVSWHPDVPVTLYASTGDLDVPISNAFHGQRVLEEHGAEARVVDVGDVDHLGSVVLSVPLVLEQFAEVTAR